MRHATNEMHRLFRRLGHLEAAIDPLGVAPRLQSPLLAAARAQSPDTAALLSETYCGPIGVELDHLPDEEAEWLAQLFETRMPQHGEGSFQLSLAQQLNAAQQVALSQEFEAFLGKKFSSFKRYSGEGLETMLPAVDCLMGGVARAGVSHVVVAMAHRGRLALQTSLGFSPRKLFHMIKGYDDFPHGLPGLSDVTSHIAVSTTKSFDVGLASGPKKLNISLLPNSSHLEGVNPLAVGKTRSMQDRGLHAMSLLIHGDAAVAGQGVVAETFALSRLPGYAVGGTVHIIANNQLGFTSESSNARSSRYASDIAKAAGAPVLHVDAEDMRGVLLASTLAAEYFAKYRSDVVIDLVGYRTHGHNEVDEPSFTNPLLYGAIRGRVPFATRYGDSLEEKGVLSREQRSHNVARIRAFLDREFTASTSEFTAATGTRGLPGDTPGTLVVGDGSAFGPGSQWTDLRLATQAELAHNPLSGVEIPLLQAIGAASVVLPLEFHVHDRLRRTHVHARLSSLGLVPEATAPSGTAPVVAGWNPATPTVDWATAEALAFGSLLCDGHPVRISGQESQRGTFSQRHAVLVDQSTGAHHVPLNYALEQRLLPAAASSTARLDAVSSPLSENAVLGFELGYSWDCPSRLAVWEAQFGDFFNGAQVVIDAFLSSGESKWLRSTGLVLLLPHGYDGAGPEHSSARIERFLQLCNAQALSRGAAPTDPADKCLTEPTNMLVANPTTPAQYFHLLRRQLLRPFRKPLIVFTPKTLLRLDAAASPLAHMGPGTAFCPVLPDAHSTAPAAAEVRRAVLCSGKLYYELCKAREERAQPSNTTFIRVEELSPFPLDVVVNHLAAFPGLAEVVWVQEEPANAGAWSFAEAHLTPALAAAGLPAVRYVGRPALSAPAVGLGMRHAAQQAAVLRAALAA